MSLAGLLKASFRAVARALAFLRATVANVLVLVILLVLAAAFFGSRPDDVPDGAALLLAPDGTIVEQETASDPLALLGTGSLAQTRLDDVLRAIEQARDDERINALVFDPSSLGYVSPAALEVIGDALATFRETGKRIVATSRYYDRDQYYLASFADDIYMHPLGEVMLGGYGMYRNYYRGLLDKLNVNVHVFRVGTYKAFVEPYTRSDMSPTAKAANQDIVDALWDRFVRRVAANRDVPPEDLRHYANRYDEHVVDAGGDNARAALDNGLVDALLSEAEIKERLRELTGEDGSESYRHITYNDYLSPRPAALLGDTVAVITASGPIVMGEPGRGFIGAGTMMKQLGEARKDDAVKAVVLRVDSGGGGMFASELIRQEVARVRKEGKPVVVSMGGTAASGGYWIGVDADEIWAAPSTITGSIGIFAIVPTFEDSLSEVGVTWDGVGTGPFVNALDPAGGLNAPMARTLQANIDHGYEKFLQLVAEGRGMRPEDVDAVGQGRVWTGEQAREHGLVDMLGHLQDAIDSAAALAELERFGVRYLEEPLSPREQLLHALLDDLGFNGLGRIGGSATERLARELALLNSLTDPKHLYAFCELCGGLR